jgi:hypothetical protein
MAITLTALLTFVLAAGLRFGPRDSTGRRPLLSAYNVVLVLCLIYTSFSACLVIINGLYFVWAPTYSGDTALSYALVASLIGSVTFICVYAVFARTKATIVSTKAGGPEPTQIASRNGWAFALIAAGWVLKLIVLQSSGGLHGTTLRLSGGIATIEHLGTLPGQVILLRYLSGVADAGVTWLLVDAIRARRRRPGVVLIFLATIGFTYLLGGKRLIVVWPLLAVGLAWHHYRRPLGASLLPLFVTGGLALGFVTLAIRVFLPANLAGAPVQVSQVEYSHGSTAGFYLNSAEFSTMQMIAVASRSPNDIVEPFGGRWDAFVTTDLEPTLYAVPRSLWHGKPQQFEDIGYSLGSLLTGTPLPAVQSGFITTIFGVNLVYGGYIGLILATALLGFIAARVDRHLLRRQWTPRAVIMYAFLLDLVFQAFRQGTLGWTVINGVVAQSGFILGALLLAILAQPVRISVPAGDLLPPTGSTTQRRRYIGRAASL